MLFSRKNGIANERGKSLVFEGERLISTLRMIRDLALAAT